MLIIYTISYNANSGSEALVNQTKTYGVNLTLSSTKPTRSGYTFQYWTASTGGNYNPGGTYTANSACTMTAYWKANEYGFNTEGRCYGCGLTNISKSVYEYSSYKTPCGQCSTSTYVDMYDYICSACGHVGGGNWGRSCGHCNAIRY